MLLAESVEPMSQFDYLDRGEQALLGLSDNCPPTCTSNEMEKVRQYLYNQFMTSFALEGGWLFQNRSEKAAKDYIDTQIARTNSNPEYAARLAKYVFDKQYQKQKIQVAMDSIKYFTNPRVTTIPNVSSLVGAYSSAYYVVGAPITDDFRSSMVLAGMRTLMTMGKLAPEEAREWLNTKIKADPASPEFTRPQSEDHRVKFGDLLEKAFGAPIFVSQKKYPTTSTSQASAFSPLPIMTPPVGMGPTIQSQACAGVMRNGQCISSAQDNAAYQALLNQGLIENTGTTPGSFTVPSELPGPADSGSPDQGSSQPQSCVCGVNCYCDAEHPQCCDIHDPVQHSFLKRMKRKHVRGLGAVDFLDNPLIVWGGVIGIVLAARLMKKR